MPEWRLPPSMALRRLQTAMAQSAARAELWLEAERDQLPLWVPVALGLGITAWLILPERTQWIGFILGALGLASAGPLLGWPRRMGRVAAIGGILAALGCALIWLRAEAVQHVVLDRPLVASFSGVIEVVDDQPAQERLRLRIALDPAPGLPAVIRVTLRQSARVEGLTPGARVGFKARLAPPPDAAIPGGYDFRRAAWFQSLGAVGQILGPIEIIGTPPETTRLRSRLSAHVHAQLSGSEGGIAAAFASGDRGGIAKEDEEAMRSSGLTHLLSISGLHVTAVIGATIFICLRLLALSPWLALRCPLPIIAAGGGALAGVGYTLLTGAEVPTVRSCIAALLVLLGLAFGREAMTLRLVATGAIVVLLIWPESLGGASFQLSFTAIAAIVALHEWPTVANLLRRREESFVRRSGRAVVGLLMTGLVVEIALAPIALFHFHKSGLYGALANMVAIPLTTFVIMPLEALALLFDGVGLGAPFWWATGKSLTLLLELARWTAGLPGAVAVLPSMPSGAYAVIALGGLWVMLWKGRIRSLGWLAVMSGATWSLLIPIPDLLITGDGRHMAVRNWNGDMVLLRERTGDYIADLMAERAGESEPLGLLEETHAARCTRDMCVTSIRRDNRTWQIAATRSKDMLDWSELTRLCGQVDIIVSERRLPPKCTPQWIKADRAFLQKNGGMIITLGAIPQVETSRGGRDDHPWVQPVNTQYRRSKPANFP
jgi:competence protein ComEC